jgi:predicted nuclease of predicted toxin-antitoxin system
VPWTPIPIPTASELAAARRDRKKARFVVDESVDPRVARYLRRRGLSVTHVSEVGLAGHSDEDVFAYAWREDRVVLTHDGDFTDDRRFPPYRNPGLVVLPTSQSTAGAAAVARVARIVGASRDLWRHTKITRFLRWLLDGCNV